MKTEKNPFLISEALKKKEKKGYCVIVEYSEKP